MIKKKKQDVPKHIQAKFQKPQYQVGDFVCITWLGGAQFGRVVDVDKKNEHVRYKVKSHTRYYICGIQIGNYASENTDYGILLADETQRRGSAAIREKAASRPVHELDRRSTSGARNETAGIGQAVDDNNNSSTTSRKRADTVTKNSVKHGASSDSKTKSKLTTRKTNKLDAAVQKQRDFLSGFVKK